MLTHPVLPTPTPMQVVRRLHFETGYYSRCWEISSAHLDAEAHRFLAELADIATPTLFLFVAFRIPYSPAIGLKLIATPWTDENLRAVEGITAKRLMQEHRKKGMPESLVHALHLAALADVRAFDAGQVRQCFLGDALAGSLIANGGPKRDGWFCFVGGRAGGSASLNRTLLH